MSAPNKYKPQTLTEHLRAIAGVQPFATQFCVPVAGAEVEVEYDHALLSGERTVLVVPFPDAAGERSGGYREVVTSSVEVRTTIAISLREAQSSDRILRAPGGQHDLHTGDMEFDKAVFVETQSDHEVVRSLLRDPASRAAIVELLRAGCSSIVLDGRSGDIILHLVRRSAPMPDPASAVQFLNLIEKLRDAMPAVVRPTRRATTMKRKTATSLFVDVVIWFLVSVTLVGVPASCVVTVLYWLLSPAACFHNSLPGKTTFSCSSATCCEPFYTGLLWGLIATCILSLPVALLRIASLPELREQRSSWQIMGMALGVCLPIGLSLGIVAARLIY
jgi:hypothetical protein